MKRAERQSSDNMESTEFVAIADDIFPWNRDTGQIVRGDI
jgi:hypothetical protein